MGEVGAESASHLCGRNGCHRRTFSSCGGAHRAVVVMLVMVVMAVVVAVVMVAVNNVIVLGFFFGVPVVAMCWRYQKWHKST